MAEEAHHHRPHSRLLFCHVRRRQCDPGHCHRHPPRPMSHPGQTHAAVVPSGITGSARRRWPSIHLHALHIVPMGEDDSEGDYLCLCGCDSVSVRDVVTAPADAGGCCCCCCFVCWRRPVHQAFSQDCWLPTSKVKDASCLSYAFDIRAMKPSF